MPMIRRAVALVVFVLLFAASAQSSEVLAEPKPAKPKFIIYSEGEDAELAATFFRVFRGDNKVDRILKADSIEKAAASEAEVLVLVMPGETLLNLEPKTLEMLKKKKIFGFGGNAARLFGKLGLEINLGNCAHFGGTPPDVNISNSELLGKQKPIGAIPPYHRDPNPDADAKKLDSFGLFIPPDSADNSIVDVIARFTGDSNYAPIVRQGNCILVGLPAPATRWSEAYTALVRDTARALHDRKLDSFSKSRRDPTKPGTYEFTLAKGLDTKKSFNKAFYLRCSEPTRITARLDHVGSDNVMLLFMSDDDRRIHWTRLDAKSGQELVFSADISQTEIEELADRNWALTVTNFDTNATANCKLVISFEKPKAATPETEP